jgi:hypothetical protein
MDKADQKELLDWWDECVVLILFCYEVADIFLVKYSEMLNQSRRARTRTHNLHVFQWGLE